MFQSKRGERTLLSIPGARASSPLTTLESWRVEDQVEEEGLSSKQVSVLWVIVDLDGL